MPVTPTISELHKAKMISDRQLRTVSEACLANPSMGVFEVAPGLRIDLGAAVLDHPYTLRGLEQPETTFVEKGWW
ncbi:hypothetical protein QA634_34815 [Methylobacterium sp. CB376]|uniref:hypothetical protein n=1 Tax=unclassified Methylobacterium TaxID=2615210 RepID=UPI0012372C05|nr:MULTISPECIES: hypothetical protein [Methylobacterium]WFT80281.1 hypothetical protein QA634_34815 [Methylobacterium nodulans]